MPTDATHRIIPNVLMTRRKLFTPSAIVGALLAVLMLAPTVRAQTSASETPDQPFGTCPGEGEVGDDQKAIQYSLYYENYKNDSYKAAIPYLRWMLKCAPLYAGPSRVGEKNFERAIRTYEGLAEQASSEETTSAYLDSALLVFDVALETMNSADVEYDPYEWAFKRGYFIQSHASQLPEVAPQAAQYYEQAYNQDAARLKPYYIDFVISDLLNRDNMPEALDFIRQVDQDRGSEQEIADIVTKYLDLIPPQERIGFLQARLENDPDNIDLLTQVFDLAEQMGNRDLMYEVGRKLQESGSTPKVVRRIATMYMEDGEYQRAFDLLEGMLQEGADPRAEDYYNMGLAQQNLDRLSSARTYYRKALEIDSDYGAAYAAIGDLYASAVSSCSGSNNLEREDRAVYWLATDYYERAKSVAPSLANRVNQKINTYQRYFPSAEDLFFWGKTAGDRYAVDYGCYAWIGEATTVRKP